MEVKAVVMQKLTDMLNEESVADNKVMMHQLKGVQKSLKKFSEEEDTRNRIHVLYEVEDEIEKFAFRVARQRKMFGFFTKQMFFFNNLNPCSKLIRKIKKIESKISSLPEDEDDEFDHETCELPQKSSSAVWKIPSTLGPEWGVLTRSWNCNDLSIDSKLCLLYMALFPKDYDIPVRRLLRLWLAEGFVKKRSQQKFPEDLAQKLFQDLVDRGMIRITKLRSDNSPKQCRLVSVLHDYLLPQAQDISLFYIHRNSEHFEDAAGHFGVRRMVQHISTTWERSFTFDPSRLRSYVSFNRPRKDTPAKEVGMLLGRIINSDFRLLRVLDLEGVNKPTLPDKLGHLCLLRYLGLRRTYLESLPESVGDLSYLETLDVKHTNVHSLPNSILKLKQLRHLNLNDIRLSMPPTSSLTLLTLWGLVLDERISVNEGFDKLLDLRELGIKFNLSESQGVLLDWIAKLGDLQSLRLRSVNDMGRPSKLILKPLANLHKLSHLNLYGNLERLPAPNEFPPTIKVLTLSISRLNEDPLETLEQLPCLMVLRLLGDSYTGKRMVCRRGGFRQLQVLKLWMLKELEEWDVEEEAMEGVKELDIRCCPKLKNIPHSLLLKQRCLEKIILTDMPDDFVAQIKKSKSMETSLTINSWKLAP